MQSCILYANFLCRYQSRGLFFDPPTCGLSHGRWQVQLPQDLQDHAQQQDHQMQTSFDTREGLFGDREGMQRMYTAYIAHGMEQYEHADSAGGDKRIASCIMEPVIQVTALSSTLGSLLTLSSMHPCIHPCCKHQVYILKEAVLNPTAVTRRRACNTSLQQRCVSAKPSYILLCCVLLRCSHSRCDPATRGHIQVLDLLL